MLELQPLFAIDCLLTFIQNKWENWMPMLVLLSVVQRPYICERQDISNFYDTRSILLCLYVIAVPALKYVFIDELPVLQRDQTTK